MVGGTLMAIMGGFFYWFPKFFGKMYSELWARLGFAFIFLGFNVTFFPQFLLGSKGMPRRYYDYLPAYESLNQMSTVGSWFITLGFLISFFVLLHAYIWGEKAGKNPWDARTLEWETSSPPPHENFHQEPQVTRRAYVRS